MVYSFSRISRILETSSSLRSLTLVSGLIPALLRISLELDLPTMTDLLARAEIALSPNNRFDLIITYFVSKRIYDIYEINAALFKYGQPILGE